MIYNVQLERALHTGIYKWVITVDNVADLQVIDQRLREQFAHYEGAGCDDTCKRWHTPPEPASDPIRIVTHKPIDPYLRAGIIDALSEMGPTTHQALADAIETDYNAVRTALLGLVAEGRVERTGAGGRKGFTYALLPGQG